MNRRDFLWSTGVAVAGFSLFKAQAVFAHNTTADGWRTFEVTTRAEVLKPAGPTKIWLPAALMASAPFQKTISNKFTADGGEARMIESQAAGLGIVAATFPPDVKPVLTLVSQVSLKNYSVDLSKPGPVRPLPSAQMGYFLQPHKNMPTDGIVKAKAAEITQSSKTDVEKARAIYEWIVDNTFRDSKVKGCGRGDIRVMLETGYLGGKCADLNALYVGLARAAGLPARDVYGIRIAKSNLGYKSLGTSSEVITKSQHCRAEVHIADRGWLPVDPADVRTFLCRGHAHTRMRCGCARNHRWPGPCPNPSEWSQTSSRPSRKAVECRSIGSPGERPNSHLANLVSNAGARRLQRYRAHRNP
jgi:transglutaminase-like putative cysteine protease